jgi:Ca2+-binding EF-hand superfamily protein
MAVIGGDESLEVDKKFWDKVLADADIDGDGKINFEEFVKLMSE